MRFSIYLYTLPAIRLDIFLIYLYTLPAIRLDIFFQVKYIDI